MSRVTGRLAYEMREKVLLRPDRSVNVFNLHADQAVYNVPI